MTNYEKGSSSLSKRLVIGTLEILAIVDRKVEMTHSSVYAVSFKNLDQTFRLSIGSLFPNPNRNSVFMVFVRKYFCI